MNSVHIDITIDQDRNYDLHDSPGRSFERRHLHLFKKQCLSARHKTKDIEAIVNEMPQGCYLAGDCIRSMVQKSTPMFYDFYFSGPEVFVSLVKRIQHARPDSIFHGYKAKESLSSVIEFEHHVMTFCKEDAPDLNLIRIRWFDTAEDLIDKMDFRMNLFAIDSNLDVVFSDLAMTDISNNYVVINRCIFQIGTGVKLSKFISEGMRYRSDTYDSYFGEQIMSRAKNHLAIQKAKGINEDLRFLN